MVDDSLLQSQHVEDGVACHFAKDGVFVLKLLRLPHCEEELRAVVVPASIGHGNQASSAETEASVELILQQRSLQIHANYKTKHHFNY